MSKKEQDELTGTTGVGDPIGADVTGEVSETGFVVVRLRDERENDALDDLVELAGSRHLSELGEVLDGARVRSAGRLVRGVPVEQQRELDRSGGESLVNRVESLAQYWRIDLRDRVEAIPDLVDRLNALPYVESAYAEPRMVTPDFIEDSDDKPPRVRAATPGAAAVYPQGYLGQKPAGIDARYAWTRPGGSGAGVCIVDLELGWQLDHVELAHLNVTRIFGDEKRGGVGHGTAVLGVLAARHDGRGVDGVVPTPNFVGVASHYDEATKTDLHVAEAIDAASRVLHRGDVLLVEVQNMGKPVEVDPGAATAISRATALGVIVVIAAGNGGQTLDTMKNRDGAQPFSPTAAAHHDTGSIIVGAGRSVVVDGGHERHTDSNFGSRVDCYAWGTLVASSGWSGDRPIGVQPDVHYTQVFKRTSSAAAIVAGAVVLIQSIHRAAHEEEVLTPTAMRDLLRNPAFGTKQVNYLPGETIGSMPDLRTIADRIAPPVPPVAPGP